VITERPDVAGIGILLDPSRGTRSFQYLYAHGTTPQGLLSYYNITSQGGYEFYPSYVRRGIFFKRARRPGYDFVSAWKDHLTSPFRRDVIVAIQGW